MVRTTAFVALAGALLAPSVAEAQYSPPQQNIVEIAAGAGNFNTLVTAVQAAGLVDVLSGEGPFTVFAPTDEAFAKIPAADLQALLADREKLTAVLTYHVSRAGSSPRTWSIWTPRPRSTARPSPSMPPPPA